MIRKITAFFLSLVILVSIFACSLSASAVAPLALVEAALASYVASTGYKLWVDNGTGSDVLSLISQLFSEFNEAQNNKDLTLLQLANGGYVGFDNSGNIIVSETAADIFQSFSDWIKTHYGVTPGSSSSTNVIQGSPDGVYDFGNGIKARRFTLGPGTIVNSMGTVYYYISSSLGYVGSTHYTFSSANNTGEVYVYYYSSGNKHQLCFLSKGVWDRTGYITTYTPPENPGYIAVQVGAPSYYWGVWDVPSGFTPLNIPTCSVWDGNAVTVGGAIPGSAGLAVSLAQDVIDRALDVASDQSLVLDVGAVAGSTATDIVDTVISGYVADTGTIPVTTTVVDTAVIDTPVQPYPDVDSLGLPELGLALTTRFPFSIPWDIGAIYSSLSHQAIAPTVTFDLIPASVLQRWHISANTSITIDLTDSKYTVLLAIIHWSCIVGFCLGLAILTKRYIWTTGG